MKQFLQALSGRAEFFIVVLGSIGISLLSNIAVALNPAIAGDLQPLNNEALIGSLFYELFVLLWLGMFMRARGWTLERLGFSVSMRDTVVGIVLALLVYGMTFVVQIVLTNVAPVALEAALKLDAVSGQLDAWAVLLSSVVSPLFEEVFICAYVISALKEKRGPVFALNVSIALRVACHLYQGAYGVLTAGALGLLFGYWFMKSGRIWPLLVAHALLSFTGLMTLD